MLSALTQLRPELASLLLDKPTQGLLAKQVAFSFEEVYAALSNSNPPSFSWDELLDLIMNIRQTAEFAAQEPWRSFVAHSGGTGGAGLSGAGYSHIDSTENLVSAAEACSSSGFGPTSVS